MQYGLQPVQQHFSTFSQSISVSQGLIWSMHMICSGSIGGQPPGLEPTESKKLITKVITSSKRFITVTICIQLTQPLPGKQVKTPHGGSPGYELPTSRKITLATWYVKPACVSARAANLCPFRCSLDDVIILSAFYCLWTNSIL